MITVLICTAIFLASFTLTYIIKNIAIKKAFVDVPNHRSSHQIPTPYGGGVAIAVTWFLSISYLFYIDEINSSLYYALMLGLIISLVSQFDDIFNLSAKIRLIIHSLVAVLALYILGGLSQIDFIYFNFSNQILTNIFAFFMIIWFINLYNFLDGIDAYAGSEGVFLAFAGYALFTDVHFLFLAFSILGFLLWNWQRAKIFMGDVGSTLLGYNVAIFAIYYQNEGNSILVWITLFGVFLADATITLLRRYKNGENILKAHKKHAYQRLTQSGYSHQKTVIFAMIINIVLFSFVYFISNVFIAFLLSSVFLYIVMRFVDAKKAFE